MINLIKNISNHILQSQDFDISIYEISFLKKAIQRRITATYCNCVEEYYTLLEQSNTEGRSLIESLQNNYSEFFRNALTFAVIERIVLPSIIVNKKKEIRIWSAACALGQEAYSIAMLLEEFRNKDRDRFKYRIFATDKCGEQLKKAQSGQYPISALNNINLKRAENWFVKKNDMFTIKPKLMENIDFSVYDLLDTNSISPSASIFGNFDIVICANLLFYFNTEIREQILNKVSKSISDGGYLITGEAEREILLKNNFSEIYPLSGIFQGKLTTKNNKGISFEKICLKRIKD